MVRVPRKFIGAKDSLQQSLGQLEIHMKKKMNKDTYSLDPAVLHRAERMIHDILYNLESILDERAGHKRL